MDISFNFPSEIGVKARVPFEFLSLCMAQDEKAKEIAETAAATCKHLCEVYPNRADVRILAGIIFQYIGNPEGAKRMMAEARLIDPENTQSAAIFRDMFEGEIHWQNANAYLKCLRSREGAVPSSYIELARKMFDEGDATAADHLLQRYLAYLSPELSQSMDVEQLQEAGGDELNCSDTEAAVQYYQNYWHSHGTEAVSIQHNQALIVPIRRQMAQLVVEAFKSRNNGASIIFEVGCFSGANLQLAQEALDTELDTPARFVGFDPNADAIAYGNLINPAFNLEVSSLERMLIGDYGMPEKIDICITGSVFSILPPDLVLASLKFLKDRALLLLICEDIMNFDGATGTILRRPMNTFLHDYSAMLAECGWEVGGVILADQPERDRTGFILGRS